MSDRRVLLVAAGAMAIPMAYWVGGHPGHDVPLWIFGLAFISGCLVALAVEE